MTQQPENIQPGDERRIAELYRESADEMPSAFLDRSILDTARKAAAQSSRQAPNEPMNKREPAWNDPRPEPRIGGGRRVSGAGNAPVFAADVADAPRLRREEQRWGKPLALAAVVVLGIGVAVRVQMQSPDLSAPQEEKVATAPAAPAPAPAPAAAASNAAQDKTASPAPSQAAAPPPPPAPPAPAAVAPTTVAQAPAVAPAAEPAGKADADVLALSKDRKAAEPEVEQAKKAVAAPPRSRLDRAAQEALAREEAARPMRDQASSELSKMQAPASAATSLSAAPNAAAAPAPAPAGAGINANATPSPALEVPPDLTRPRSSSRYSTDAPASARAGGAINADSVPTPPTAGAASAAPAAKPAAPPLYESDPDLWSRRIIEMRRGGRGAAADAELRRLRARYPDFKVPEAALPPPAAPAQPAQ